MVQRFSTMVLAFVVFAGLGHPDAQAAEDNSREIMAGCRPDAASLRDDRCKMGGHGVFHKGTAGGTCRLICPIPKHRPDDQWDGAQLFYRDPDGQGTNYRIQARLKKANLGSRVSADVCTLDSNKYTQTNYTTRNCTFQTSFNPHEDVWYWFEVVISRAPGATAEVEVLGYDIY
jgi:hypothetical protein